MYRNEYLFAKKIQDNCEFNRGNSVQNNFQTIRKRIVYFHSSIFSFFLRRVKLIPCTPNYFSTFVFAIWQTCAGNWLRTVTSDRTVYSNSLSFELVGIISLDRNYREVINLLFVLLILNWGYSSVKYVFL